MDVVIVESPAKAKTINKYLGSNYKVLASYGHVRDLPAKDGSVRPDEDFSMDWEVGAPSQKRLSEIAQAVKSADALVLATDPDREGEAISWHVLEVLRQKRALGDKPVSRVVFNAITKKAVLDAMANPRMIDAPLVDAYLARRALDYLVGFTLSPVLWRKLPGARSAGRVQSVALRLVCDRESEIERFKPEEYWQIAARLATPRGEEFVARLSAFEGEKLQRMSIGDGARAGTIRDMLDGASFSVLSVEAKPGKRNPSAPFTTSTLQQAASAKLGFSASRTMQVAQRLYEGVDVGGETVGLITYMRTDGVQMAPEAIEDARAAIASVFGDRYLPAQPRQYSVKAKNAQEAHEAIRPTAFGRSPKEMERHLDRDQARLYDLIWKRSIASQMASADIERTTADIRAANGGREAMLRATGSVIRFDGFIAAYVDHRDDSAGADEGEEDTRLPAMAARDALDKRAVDASQHFTEPPPRYSEASLIKKMEELGIGRPSTYAATLQTLQDREYITQDKRKLLPQAKGRLVTAFLHNFFEKYIEYDFTADLEEKLDRISAGELSWKDVLRDFWQDFSRHVDGTKELRVSEVLDALNEELGPLVFPPKEDGSEPRACPRCGTGQLSLKLGKYGAFVGCSNYPECGYTRQLGTSLSAEAAGDTGSDEPSELGTDPQTGEPVTLRNGRFGPYVQRGDGKEAKRSSLPKGWQVSEIDLDKALQLLSLPREVGLHPETGKPILAGLGRYGPFLQHDGAYANLETIEDVLTVGLNRAVTVIAEKKEKGGRGRSTPAAIATLGEHPDLGGPITVRDGRFGPYVNVGKVNATLPKGKEPSSVTLEEAIALLTERAAKTGTGKPKAAKSAAKKAKADTGDGEAKPAKKPAASRAKATGKTATAKTPGARKPAAKAAASKSA
ncbi:type I DNA topoisomerase [Mangrovibrevibacter kandeliae]|uniref:type I DNA topoisomerase n=1 Tax=Mangrovibrevibacter kandeliae TaxID=2968473 RepID=UPI0021181545|nr:MULTISPECIES: type I DNA topoisomerase [unclassified Aurantimonas]MCQ8782506.1 type I DNA topoisomerase [Aurantimonas sp. CSK15Z-1]MCW4114685.1 type I DNA topoisomerase [Aurantimonas sp. MSK8Z-1]